MTNNVRKSLGQVAFEALWYGLHQWPGRPWKDVGPPVQEAWQAVAEAVVKESRVESVHAFMQSVIHKGDEAAKERAVIEAAEAAKTELRAYVSRHDQIFGTSNPYYRHAFHNLLEAVEELQKESKG